MTTTKAPKPALPDWQAELSDELDRADSRQRACYAILLNAASGDELTREELNFLRVNGFDDRTRHREIGKLGRMLDQYRTAGTEQQREAAAENLQTVEAELVPAVEQMKAEVERLQREIDRAEQQVQQARGEVQRRAAAVEQLQSDELLPQFVLDQLAEVRRAESATEAAAIIREGEARGRLIETVLKITDERQKLQHAKAVKHFNGEPLLTGLEPQNGMITPRLNQPVWQRYLAALQAELPSLVEAMAAADRQLEPFRREAAELRRYWLQPSVQEQLEQMEVLS